MTDQAPAAPVTPSSTTPPAPVEPKPVATEPAGEDWGQKYRKLEAEHQKKLKEQIIERRKWDADRKTTGERLSKLSELEKREQQARLNPPEFLKSIYGDNWHEVVNESKINGVPPAQLLEAEMAKMREEFKAELRARDEEGTKSLQAQQQKELDQARANIRIAAEEFYTASAAEYPILEDIGDKAAVARTLAQRIEKEFRSSIQYDEAGNLLKQGRVLTAKDAAELIEGEMLAIAEHALKAEKYKPRFAPKPPDLTPEKKSESLKLKQQPSSQQQSSGQQPRKSLSNEITGSTKDEAPTRLTPDERRKRSLAAYDAVRERKSAAH
jgi:hypothetical protein